MKRRSFLRTTIASAGFAGAGHLFQPGSFLAAEGGAREYCEIRKYTLNTPEKQAVLDAYLRDAAIPALNRLGIASVGVFYQEKPGPKPQVFVMLRYPTLDLLGKGTQLLSDAALQGAAAGAGYLGAVAEDPVYERVESWLTHAIEGMPAMAVPAKGHTCYQLRIYESHNERAGRKKIEMFNIGELEIFRRCGMTPVFFGETVVGPVMPNLTYLLVFKDAAAKDAGWNAFRGDPAWAKLKATPCFSDKEIVSRITNIMLVPAAYSQI